MFLISPDFSGCFPLLPISLSFFLSARQLLFLLFPFLSLSVFLPGDYLSPSPPATLFFLSPRPLATAMVDGVFGNRRRWTRGVRGGSDGL
jgi:hypothetical protein